MHSLPCKNGNAPILYRAYLQTSMKKLFLCSEHVFVLFTLIDHPRETLIKLNHLSQFVTLETMGPSRKVRILNFCK